MELCYGTVIHVPQLADILYSLLPFSSFFRYLFEPYQAFFSSSSSSSSSFSPSSSLVKIPSLQEA